MYMRALALLTFLCTSISSFGAIVNWNSSGTTFVSGDIVIYNNKNYVALGGATNSTLPPDQDSTNFLDIEQNMPEVAPTTPAPEWNASQIAAIQQQAEALTAPDSNASISESGGLISLSIRGEVGTGDNIRIMGFVLSGTGNVLMRGLGPVLTEYGLPDSGSALSLIGDPKISLYQYNDSNNPRGNSSPLTSGDNDNYGTSSNVNDITTAVNAIVPKVNLNDSQAISFLPISSGFYTCQLEDVNGGTGIGVSAVDLYDSSTERFTHLSSRGLVSIQEYMFGRFQISGTNSRKILIRGRGSSLSDDNISNPMADPYIELWKYASNPNDDLNKNPPTLVKSNDDYTSNSNFGQIASKASSIYGGPALESEEAAIMLDLEPGYYSAQLHCKSSADNGKVGWIGIDDVTD